MSTQVANINLSSATAGQTGTLVTLKNLLPPPTLHQQMRPQDVSAVARLVIFNETACLITLKLPESKQTKTLPAGRWLILPIPPNETEIDYQVLTVASGASFGNLLADFYLPGEQVEDLGVLGNSPIGGTVGVSSASIQTQSLVVANNATGVADLDLVELKRNGSFGTGDLVWEIDQNGFLKIRDQLHTSGIGPFPGIPIALRGDQVELLKPITQIVDQPTVGNYGVAPFAAQALRQTITVTTLQTLLTYAVPASGGIYRVNVYVNLNNAISGNKISVKAGWSDSPFLNTGDAFVTAESGTPTRLDGTPSVLNGVIACLPIVFAANGSSNIIVQYQDPTNTPSDTVTVIMERLA